MINECESVDSCHSGVIYARVKTASMPMVKNVLMPTNVLSIINASLMLTLSKHSGHIRVVIRLVTLATV